MPLTSHDLIFLGLTALAAFIGARFGSGGKSDAGAARVEQKIDSILSGLGLPGYSVKATNAPVSENVSFASNEEQIIRELRRGRKIEAVRLYREQHQVGLKEAKDAVDQIEPTLC